tara:strand:+ start:68 stop:565 length:498 start_codon:yes stop_codon:yes gene_type:complete
MDLFIEAVYLMLSNNTLNILVLVAMILISTKKSTVVLWVFIFYYIGYLAADVSMQAIGLSLHGGSMEDFQKTWRLLLAMLAAIMMLSLLINGLFYGTNAVQVLTCVYIMLFYVVPNVGFAGFSGSSYDHIYSRYSDFGVPFDVVLIALSLIKARGNECNKMAYNG